jgi:hypothetical protein
MCLDMPYCIILIYLTPDNFTSQGESAMGLSRKDPYSPHRGNFCRPKGRGEKIVSDNSKCIRTSKGGSGVNFLFPPWGWMDVFWNDPIT